MQDRNYILDFYKFIASLFIAVLHLSWKYAPQAYLFVEFFFLASGFMIGLNINQYKNINILTLAKNRLHAFYMSYFFAFFIYYIICNHNVISFDFLITLTMLPYIGIFKVAPNPFWFLGAYFYLSILYVILLHFLTTRSFLILVTLIVISFIGCYFYIGYLPINHSLERNFLYFPYSFFRGEVGLGFGILAGYFFKNFYQFFPENLSIFLQCFSILFLSYYIFLIPTPAFDVINYAVMIFLIYSSFYMNIINNALEIIAKKLYKIISIYLSMASGIHRNFKKNENNNIFYRSYIFIYYIGNNFFIYA